LCGNAFLRRVAVCSDHFPIARLGSRLRSSDFDPGLVAPAFLDLRSYRFCASCGKHVLPVYLGYLAERMLGNWNFLSVYVLSGLGGSVASMWRHPFVVSAGASGAVLGVAGGLMTFLYFEKRRVPRLLIKKIIKQNLTSVSTLVIVNVVYGFGDTGTD